MIIAALLHDTVEDTETSPQENVERSGERVASMVVEVIDDKSLPKATRKELQVATAASKSEGDRLIKLADKISNVRDLGEHPPRRWTEERMQAYREFAANGIKGARGVSEKFDRVADETLGLPK